MLTFKMGHPRIEYYLPDNYFVFEIYVKASIGATYLYGSQVNCNVTITNVNTAIPLFITEGFTDGNYDPPGPPPPVDKYWWTANYASSKLNIAIVHTSSIDPYYPAAYSAVTSSYQLLCTVYVPLLAGAVTGTAGITFDMAAMGGGNQTYATGIPPAYNAPYLDPVSEGNNFSNIYYGHIFSGAAGGWSEWGGTVNWTNARNTSVWDTTTTAATLPVTGSNAGSLRIHSGARLVISPAKDLTCTGNTDINEIRGLVIQAGSGGMGQFRDNGTITYGPGGNVRAEVYLAQEKWHYYSIPITSTTTAPFYNLYMKYYNEPAGHWNYIINPGLDSILNVPMKGYAMWSDATNPPMGNYTAKVTGFLNTGAVSIGISGTGNPMNGWNLVGNPYPSCIDLSLPGVTWFKVYQTAWFWDPTAGNYITYVFGGTGLHSKYAPPQQGFFVRHDTTDYSPAHFDLNNSVRVINSEPFLKSREGLPDYLILTARKENSEKNDKTVVHFRDDATLGFDAIYDAFKLEGDLSAPQMYTSIITEKLCVNSLPWTDENQTVPLGFYSGLSDNFSIVAENIESFRSGIKIFLEDLKENVVQELTMDPEYPFTYFRTDNPDRFLLHFINPFVGSMEKQREDFQVYSYKDAVYVKSLSEQETHGTISIFDQAGRYVFSSMLNNIPLNVYRLSVHEGLYLVRIQTDQTIKVTNVYLHFD
jgi:hypothetical protein